MRKDWREAWRRESIGRLPRAAVRHALASGQLLPNLSLREWEKLPPRLRALYALQPDGSFAISPFGQGEQKP